VTVNSESSAVTIPVGSIAIAAATSQPGCPASTNFTVVHGLNAAVTIPKNVKKMSLNALGIAQDDGPVIAMIGRDTNQDACEGISLTLYLSDSAVG
jgi:hypothetical protein